MFANVIVDISLQKLDKTFSYKVPKALEGEMRPGVKVLVPFGKRELTGYVLEVTDKTDVEEAKLKEIICIEAKSVPIESELILLASYIREQYGCTMNQALKTVLPAKKQIAKKKIRVVQTPIAEADYEKVVLNDEQRQAVEGIIKNYPRTALIHGITGSGKTEVYMNIIDEMIKCGKQTILLIPEISLTFQNLGRFHARYGERIGVVNSRLSAGEKYEVFKKASEGKIDVIIGPRSAIFTPFSQLGLIIVDEEHSTSYVSETAPRYRANEVALLRAGISGACVVLGSATPLIDDYKKALDGEYDLYKLTKRAIPGSDLPKVSIVDLRQELKDGNKTIFSRELATDIRDRLDNHEQVMLFLNRRGYARFVSCRSCGEAIKCPHCDVSLTLHGKDRLVCHYCGHEERTPSACPKCGSPYIFGFGLGTEQVEDNIKKYFEDAKVLRMDADTTSGKAGHSKILSKFASGDADILVGTQMIVKGHDFPNVTLVGVIAADLSLYSNDYTAGERTFELLTQAAGRAGRSGRRGKVVIQTYNPDNNVIIQSANQDYESFYNDEITYRKLLAYPPMGAMLSVLMTNASEEEVASDAEYLTNTIMLKYNKNGIKMVGPSDAGVKKIEDKYRKIFYIKHPDKALLKQIRDEIYLEPIGSNLQMDIL